MADDNLVMNAVVFGAVVTVGLFVSLRNSPWDQVLTSIDISFLKKYSSGARPPPDAKKMKGKSFLEIIDHSVHVAHDSMGGLGVPNSFMAWNWGMVPFFGLVFTALFYLTTPAAMSASGPFPWLTFVQKLFILFNQWEALGMGVQHGPLHGLFNPPFLAWWYRITPGTMKYAGPAGHWNYLPMKRNYLDALVEGVLTHIFSLRCLLSPEVTPELAIPLACCMIYEFLFDYGQHMHTYATQNMHLIVCMCFPVGQGQVVGMQLFLTLLYIGSGWCKFGPTFPHMFTINFMTAKFMLADVCPLWLAEWFRRWTVVAHDQTPPDYTKTKAAWWLSNGAAVIEFTVPFFLYTNNWYLVWFSIVTFQCMHIFIIGTLIIDVFVWNFADAIGYVVLYGMLGTGICWEELPHMHPYLQAWLIAHACYAAFGHIVPDAMPYVVAHRHAAGNWAAGVLLIKKSAIGKLSKLKVHSGSRPLLEPGKDWASDWFTFYLFAGYAWAWNFPSKLLPRLVVEAVGADKLADGQLHRLDCEYDLFHSANFFDAVINHLRIDGLSNLRLTEELGRVCEFEPGECKLCWAGAFPSFMVSSAYTPTANWKILDSVAGVLKEGKYDAATLNNPEYKKPSDCMKLRLLDGPNQNWALFSGLGPEHTPRER